MLSYTNEMNACEDVGLFLANTAGPYADEDEYEEQNRDSVHVYETPGSVPVNESPGSVHVYESPDHIVQYGKCSCKYTYLSIYVFFSVHYKKYYN